MEIKVNASVFKDELQEYSVKELRYGLAPLVEGYWAEGPYHGGYREYSYGVTSDGVYILNSRSRNQCLDDITQRDIDGGWPLNDDQLQAIHNHGGSLEEAQNFKSDRIVVVGIGFPPDMDDELIANKLYKAFIDAGGQEIIEFL